MRNDYPTISDKGILTAIKIAKKITKKKQINIEKAEIVLNLWYIVDEGTDYAYCLLGRAYTMTGTDEEKLERLRQLAPTDYLMADRLRVPQNF